MIELLKGFPDNVVAAACQGQITKNDYDTVLVPAVEKALKSHDKIRFYYEAGANFAGIDASAAWEDFKVGMEHFLRWERVAVVTDVEWIKHTMRIFSFVMPAEMRVFPVAETAKAREWIAVA